LKINWENCVDRCEPKVNDDGKQIREEKVLFLCARVTGTTEKKLLEKHLEESHPTL
jgi:hypothetical protein